jgi:hypothetical protein
MAATAKKETKTAATAAHEIDKDNNAHQLFEDNFGPNLSHRLDIIKEQVEV